MTFPFACSTPAPFSWRYNIDILLCLLFAFDYVVRVVVCMLTHVPCGATGSCLLARSFITIPRHMVAVLQRVACWHEIMMHIRPHANMQECLLRCCI